MRKVTKKTQALFEKAYRHNWDDGVLGLKPILADAACDRATATMIFWTGSPAYYYDHPDPAAMKPYEAKRFTFLKALASDVLAGKYPVALSYTVDPALLPASLGSIPSALAEPIVGAMSTESVLRPATNPFQDEVLALCQRCPSVEAMAALAARGADFEQKILDGYALPIVVALNHGQVEAVRYLLQRGMDPNRVVQKAPLLFYAALAGHMESVALLLEHGATVRTKGAHGRTVLHAIANEPDRWSESMQAIVRRLVAEGADVRALDSQKRTPAALARELGNGAFASFLA